MNAELVNGLQIVASFAIMMIAFIVALNWLMRGMLVSFIRVRASRGKKTMAEIHGVNEIYFKVGAFSGSTFKYKDRDGKECTYAKISADSVHSWLGVKKVEIDEVNACIWTRDGAIIQGNDPVAVDNLIKRAIESPEVKDKMIKWILFLLVLMLLMGAIELFVMFNVLQTLGKTTLATVIS